MKRAWGTRGIIGHHTAKLPSESLLVTSRAYFLALLVFVVQFWAVGAKADGPRVVTDIAPVHSLVVQVLGELGSAELLIKGNASPHDYAFRPSVAKALSKADVVVMVGPELTPWLNAPLKKLAPNAQVLSLLAQDGTHRLPARDDAEFAAHVHDATHVHADDPHAWLDPLNAVVWIDAIQAALTQADQTNAAHYQRNASTAKASATVLHDQLLGKLASFNDQPFLVFHDSFQYYENRFNVKALGSIAASDASQPGPARVAHIRKLVRREAITCILGEPQFNTKLVRAVAPDAKLVTVDILGSKLELGAEFYTNLLLDITASVQDCLQ